ncbi:MAG: T9SS type A sorting domain-containing protein, partial [Bacteroidia bacterium]
MIIPFVFWAAEIDAREIGAGSNRQQASGFRVAASCTPATSQTDLDINNVRTTILGGGDMWWDLSSAKYEIPKGSRTHSSYASSLWIGGFDPGGQLKVAAMTYRQTGNDFWPGPLDNSVSIDASECVRYDQHWKISRSEVEDFVNYYCDPNRTPPPGYTVPLSIQNWPGNGNVAAGQLQQLAPFHDSNGDGIYQWQDCDYPAYNLSGETNCSKNQLFGDQTIWWVFNDKGNVHSETGANSIGLEIRAQAFAFATNDEINNMTFYSYQIINRASTRLTNTYFGQWSDSDVGDATDDYVGCDVTRGMGFTYNGDQNDGASAQPSIGTYGANPPAFGVDFFEGPLADSTDGIDNDRDGIIDERGEQIIMSKFVYYNNDFSTTGNPENASDYYDYLSGNWKDGTPVTYGGNGY